VNQTGARRGCVGWLRRHGMGNIMAGRCSVSAAVIAAPPVVGGGAVVVGQWGPLWQRGGVGRCSGGGVVRVRGSAWCELVVGFHHTVDRMALSETHASYAIPGVYTSPRPPETENGTRIRESSVHIVHVHRRCYEPSVVENTTITKPPRGQHRQTFRRSSSAVIIGRMETGIRLVCAWAVPRGARPSQTPCATR